MIHHTDLLDALVTSSLPTILVSCKCDNPENTRQINVDNVEAACLSAVEAVKFASNVPESARLCLSSMLRAIMMNRNGQLFHSICGHFAAFHASRFSLPSLSILNLCTCFSMFWIIREPTHDLSNYMEFA
jgi:hypothetical protein